MKRSIQIILVLCFCFTLAAKAQITKIDTYSNKIKGLSAAQKDELDLLFFGSVPKIFISEEGKSIMLWPEKGSVKTVELNYKQIQHLKDESLSISYKSVEVISIDIQKDKAFRLDDSYLSKFPNLKYLLISSSDEISMEEIKSILRDLSASNQLEVLFHKINASS